MFYHDDYYYYFGENKEEKKRLWQFYKYLSKHPHAIDESILESIVHTLPASSKYIQIRLLRICKITLHIPAFQWLLTHHIKVKHCFPELISLFAYDDGEEDEDEDEDEDEEHCVSDNHSVSSSGSGSGSGSLSSISTKNGDKKYNRFFSKWLMECAIQQEMDNPPKDEYDSLRSSFQMEQEYGMDSLFTAIVHNSLEWVSWLLTHKADINRRSNARGETPLFGFGHIVSGLNKQIPYTPLFQCILHHCSNTIDWQVCNYDHIPVWLAAIPTIVFDIADTVNNDEEDCLLQTELIQQFHRHVRRHYTHYPDELKELLWFDAHEDERARFLPYGGIVDCAIGFGDELLVEWLFTTFGINACCGGNMPCPSFQHIFRLPNDDAFLSMAHVLITKCVEPVAKETGMDMSRFFKTLMLDCIHRHKWSLLHEIFAWIPPSPIVIEQAISCICLLPDASSCAPILDAFSQHGHWTVHGGSSSIPSPWELMCHHDFVTTILPHFAGTQNLVFDSTPHGWVFHQPLLFDDDFAHTRFQAILRQGITIHPFVNEDTPLVWWFPFAEKTLLCLLCQCGFSIGLTRRTSPNHNWLTIHLRYMTQFAQTETTWCAKSDIMKQYMRLTHQMIRHHGARLPIAKKNAFDMHKPYRRLVDFLMNTELPDPSLLSSSSSSFYKTYLAFLPKLQLTEHSLLSYHFVNYSHRYIIR